MFKFLFFLLVQTVVVNENTERDDFIDKSNKYITANDIPGLAGFVNEYSKNKSDSLIKIKENLYVSHLEYLLRSLGGNSSSELANYLRDKQEDARFMIQTVEGKVLSSRECIERGDFKQALTLIYPLVKDESVHSDKRIMKHVIETLKLADMYEHNSLAAHLLTSHSMEFPQIKQDERPDFKFLPAGSVQIEQSTYREIPTEYYDSFYYGKGEFLRRRTTYLGKSVDGFTLLNTESKVSLLIPFAGRLKSVWEMVSKESSNQYDYEERLLTSPVFDDGFVYAQIVKSISPSEVNNGYIYTVYPFPKRALMKLDLMTGEVIWSIGGDFYSDTFEGYVSFNSEPLIYKDTLVIGAIAQRSSRDPFSHYLLIIDKYSGRILKRTLVASGTTQINLFGNSIKESLSSNVVLTPYGFFYSTNLGAAGLFGFGGEIKWILKYPKIEESPSRAVNQVRRPASWLFSSPVFSSGLMLVAPLDSNDLHAVDAVSGELIYSITRSGDAKYFPGVTTGKLVIAGEVIAFHDVKSGTINTTLPLTATGMPYLYGNLLFVPSGGEVAVIDCSNVKVVKMIKCSAALNGNVYFDGSSLLVGNEKELSLYLVESDVSSLVNTLISGDVEKLAKMIVEGSLDNANNVIRGSLRIFLAERYSEEKKHDHVLKLLSGLDLQNDRVLSLKLNAFEAVGDLQSYVDVLTVLLAKNKSSNINWQKFQNMLSKVLFAGDNMKLYSKHNKEAESMYERVMLNPNRTGLVDIYRMYPFAEVSEQILSSAVKLSLAEQKPNEAAELIFILKTMRKGGLKTDLIADLIKTLSMKGMRSEIDDLLSMLERSEEQSELKDKLISEYRSKSRALEFGSRFIDLQSSTVKKILLPDIGAVKSSEFIGFNSSGITEVYGLASLSRLKSINIYPFWYFSHENRLCLIALNSIIIFELEGGDLVEKVRIPVNGVPEFAKGVNGFLLYGMQSRISSGYEFKVIDINSGGEVVSKLFKNPIGALRHNNFAVAFVTDNKIFMNVLGKDMFFEISLTSELSAIRDIHIPKLTDSLVIAKLPDELVCFDMRGSAVIWKLDVSSRFERFSIDEGVVVSNEYIYFVDLATGKRSRKIPLNNVIPADFAYFSGKLYLLGSDMNLYIDMKKVFKTSGMISTIFDVKQNSIVIKTVDKGGSSYQVYDKEGKLIKSIPEDKAFAVQEFIVSSNRAVAFGIFGNNQRIQVYD